MIIVVQIQLAIYHVIKYIVNMGKRGDRIENCQRCSYDELESVDWLPADWVVVGELRKYMNKGPLA